MLRKFLGAAALATLIAGPAQAVEFGFTGTVQFGTFSGTVGVGSLIIDDELLQNVGEESVTPLDSEIFSLTFTIFDQTFTAANDVDFPEFPEAFFVDGALDALDFVVSEYDLGPGLIDGEEGGEQILTEINQEGVFGFSFEGLFGELPPIDDEFVLAATAVTVPDLAVFVDEIGPQPVPVPATLPLLAGALLVAGAVARRRRS